MFFDARSAAPQQLATTNQLMNSLVERASRSLSLSLSLCSLPFYLYLSLYLFSPFHLPTAFDGSTSLLGYSLCPGKQWSQEASSSRRQCSETL